MSLAELNEMKPLNPNDPDFPVAVAAMKNALTTEIGSKRGERYWLVDLSGSEATDIVSVVDLTAIGNIARGTIDWPEAAGKMRIHRIDDRHSAQDVLEAVIWRLRQIRTEPASEPQPMCR